MSTSFLKKLEEFYKSGISTCCIERVTDSERLYSKVWRISGQTHSVHGTPRLTRGFLITKKSRSLNGSVYIAYADMLSFLSLFEYRWLDYSLKSSFFNRISVKISAYPYESMR